MTASETQAADPDESGKAKAKKPRKAPAKKPRPAPPEGPIAVRWDLADLPSSQHKAGLAGLAICVKYLERKAEVDARGSARSRRSILAG